jgi:hypothetical protein
MTYLAGIGVARKFFQFFAFFSWPASFGLFLAAKKRRKAES